MRIVVANTVGRLENGQLVVAFPSRWDSVVAHKTGGRFDFYPYELGYTAALLKRELPAASVVMVDGCHECLGPADYIERLAELRPDVLITECSALTYSAMTRVMHGLKNLGLSAALLAGPYGMHKPGKAGYDGWLVIPGEFETKMLQACGGPAAQPGYIDLDDLPWPEDDDVSRIEYEEPFGNPYPGMVQVYPTRGCPLACKFCVVPMYYGGHGHSHKSHRTRDVENVCDEIEYLAGKYAGQFNGCYFHEETHNADPDWLARFAEALIRRGLDRYHYDAMCGYWTFTPDLVQLLARAGYARIRMGIESLDTSVGRRIGKVVFEDKLVSVLEWCKAAGILTYGTSMVGAPGSTAAKDLATLAGLRELHGRGLLDIWQHSVATPQPGTPFYAEVKAAGYLLTEDPAAFNGVQPVVSWPDYPAAEIARVKRAFEN